MMKRLFWLVFFAMSMPAFAQDKLIILSPHRKSIQREFVPSFEAYYKKTYKTSVDVEWIDQGGTSDDVRFLRAKFAKNPKSIGIDIFWGGGSAVFSDLAEAGYLAPMALPDELQKQIPAKAAGVPLRDDKNLWHGSALSSFGIFYNKKLLQFDNLPAPKTWQDLAKPVYQGNISLTDPRRSGSANTMNTIILQSMGWEKGWRLLTLIAANARSFTHSSSDPIKSVVSGDAALALAIDFYALAKVGDLGPENLGFVLPEGQTVLDPDPVAILKGAPHREAAERFVRYILSAEAQKRLVLPKKEKDGPEYSSLGRMAVNRQTYEVTEDRRINKFNPFAQSEFLTLDLDRASQMQRVFNDLVGALLVDTHQELREAWAKIIKNNKAQDSATLKQLTAVPLTEKEFNNLLTKWDDEVYRNQAINRWVDFAKKKYEAFQ
jgi:ABC-type Fe3+ transport system substrate-binding protein